MSQVDSQDEWIFVLNREQLVTELQRRRLSIDGSYSILTARLLRRVRYDRLRLSFEPYHAMTDNENLDVPLRDTAPDSPAARAEPFFQAQSPVTPRSDGHRSSRDNNNNSAATAYNVMRKWNLKFSYIKFS